MDFLFTSNVARNDWSAVCVWVFEVKCRPAHEL